MLTESRWSILIVIALTAKLPAQIAKPLSTLDEVGVNERLDQPLPVDVQFRNSRGEQLRFGQLFDGERPVILSLNYSDCPMLCQLQLNGLVNGLKDVSWSVGEQFEVVSVSIDPRESTRRARQTKQRYVEDYGRPGSATGWHFMTGEQDAISTLCEAVGFRYRYLPDRKEYAHAAVVILCTPQGRVSRYLYGVNYPAQTLKLSLLEAADGKIGSTLDRVLLFCFHYDAAAGRYAPAARRMMKAGAFLTLVILTVGLVPIWFNRRRAAASAPAARQTSERHRRHLDELDRDAVVLEGGRLQ